MATKKQLENSLKEFSTGKDLVKAGLFSSITAFRSARFKGRAPKGIKPKGRNSYLYHKSDVIKWVMGK